MTPRPCHVVQWRQFMIGTWLGKVIVALMAVTLGIVTWSQTRGNAPMSAVLAPIILLVIATLGIASLHVSIQVADKLTVRFWPFPPRRIQLSEISCVEVVQYSPIRDYGGWGLKWGKGGVAYTIGGNIGVRVDLHNGRHLMLSSKQPAAVRDEITRRLHG